MAVDDDDRESERGVVAPIRQAADRLDEAARHRDPCAPVRDLLRAGDVDAAYAVQALLTERAVASGRRIVGRKIGLTSLAVQRQLGVGQPDFGTLFADMVVGEGLPIPGERLMQPKIEAEVAILLDRDLDMEAPTPADVLRATGFVMPALEIVGSRIRGWDITIVDTIADNASSGLLVLGGPARPIAGLDLRACTMRMTRGDERVSEGTGAACLGSPLNAASWLASEMVRRGQPLRAGDLVMTGALGPMTPVSAGDVIDAHIEGLGRVTAVFS